MSWRLLSIAGALLTSLSAQDVADGTRIHVRVLGDRLVARCGLKSPTTSVESHVWIEIGRPGALQLHHSAAQSLGVEGHQGHMATVTVVLDGEDLRVTDHQHGDERAIDRFNRIHAEALEQVPCRGGLGAGALAGGVQIVDLARSLITLLPSTPRADLPDEPGTTYLRASFIDGVAWIDVPLADGGHGMVAIGSSRFDSVIDERLWTGAGSAPALPIGDLDLSQVVAWRPEPRSPQLPQGAAGVLGIGFLKSFRVTLDATNGIVGLTRVATSPFPSADAECFAARTSGEPARLLAWLESNRAHRLAPEAAEWLLRWQVDRNAPAEDVETAARWLWQTTPLEFRAAAMVGEFDRLMGIGRVDEAVTVGELGLTTARSDRYPRSVHRLQLRLGEVLLERDEDDRAWRYLLSAAFGLNDAVGTAERSQVNLLLGQLYEKRGKLTRALSRYVQAVVSADHGAAAVAAIERVQRAAGESFSVDLIDRLTSGRVGTLTAPDRFEPDDQTDTGRCVLVEHFVNPHVGVQQGDQWQAYTVGGTAVFQALLTHFPRDRVAMLTWHGDDPRAVATMNELSVREFARIGKAFLFHVDGLGAGEGALRIFDAEPNYQKVKKAVYEALARRSEFELALHATYANGTISGRLEVRGPQRDEVVVQIVLAERGVIYPGLGQTVVHRMVARAALTDDMDGVAWRPSSGRMQIPFGRPLTAIEAANVAFLEEYERRTGEQASRLSAGIDPRQLTVVAIVRDRTDDWVLQSSQVDVLGADRERAR